MTIVIFHLRCHYVRRICFVMLHATRANKQHLTGRVKFPGICEAAKVLGCSRVHLWQVLTGKRISRSLKARYNALKRSGGRATLGGGK